MACSVFHKGCDPDHLRAGVVTTCFWMRDLLARLPREEPTLCSLATVAISVSIAASTDAAERSTFFDALFTLAVVNSGMELGRFGRSHFHSTPKSAAAAVFSTFSHMGTRVPGGRRLPDVPVASTIPAAREIFPGAYRLRLIGITLSRPLAARVAVRCSISCQLPALLEWITAPAGRLHLVAHCLGRRQYSKSTCQRCTKKPWFCS